MNLEDEVICDFLVPARQKRVNAVYIDLMQEFGRLCEKHGITWWLYAGGLIGAVRHKGFIPWDDDIDLMMPRADFDRLQAMTNEQFGAKEPYFLQNTTTEPACINALIRFRRSDTTDIRPEDLDLIRARGMTEPPYNMGLNLAIFPLDSVPKSELARKLQQKTAYFLWGVFYRTRSPEEGKPVKNLLCRAACKIIGEANTMKLTHSLYRAPRRVRDELQSYDGLYPGGRLRWTKGAFSDTVWLPFEDIMVPAPVGYDEFLREFYGDYMQLPPVEKRVLPHGSILDADRPYPEVLREVLGG